jgi:hypothetical protein
MHLADEYCGHSWWSWSRKNVRPGPSAILVGRGPLATSGSKHAVEGLTKSGLENIDVADIGQVASTFDYSVEA